MDRARIRILPVWSPLRLDDVLCGVRSWILLVSASSMTPQGAVIAAASALLWVVNKQSYQWVSSKPRSSRVFLQGGLEEDHLSVQGR